MTTQRQIAANRRNARMSTGPRMAAGKAAASGNARRHGLTAELDEDVVLSWFRMLLEDEMAVPGPYEQDSYRRAALELARAEAHLQRVRATEEQLLREVEVSSKVEMDFHDLRDRTVDTLLWDVLGAQSEIDVFRLVPDDEAWLLPRERPRPPADHVNVREDVVETARSLGMSIKLPPVDEAALKAAYDDALDAYADKLDAFVRNPFVKVGWDKKGFGLMRQLDREIDRVRKERRDAYERVAPTLVRYRALAEARRARALARWTDQVVFQSHSEGAKPVPDKGDGLGR